MSTTAINSLSGNLQSLLATALKGTGLSASTATGTSSTSSTQSSDTSQLSPLAQLMSTLQQLQQSDPTQYQKVTQQIATNLQKAAQTATADGNAAQATQLNQLATDFTDASKTGQLPSTKDLAQAVGGGHHHHHAHGTSDTEDQSSASSANSSPASTNSSTQTSQALSSYQSASTESQAQSLNPASIIFSTLSSTDIGFSNS